jgi:hypothetical protein
MPEVSASAVHVQGAGPDMQELREMINKSKTGVDGQTESLLREMSNWDVRAQTEKATRASSKGKKSETLSPIVIEPQAVTAPALIQAAPLIQPVEEVILDGMDLDGMD